MRLVALLAMLCCSLTLFAANRQWKDATVVDAKTGSAGSVAVGSVSGNSYGASGLAIATRLMITYYTIDSGDMEYIVECVPRGTLRYRCPNITVHGKTKISIDGRNAHILDDDGKDRKVPIVEKILKQESPKP